MDVLAHLLSARLERGPYADLGAFLAHLASCPPSSCVERALWGGAAADRLGYAFAAGYGAALARLLETAEVRAEGSFALAATETGGAHPRAIATRLEGDVLDGEKTFVTLATAADELLVVASRGLGADGRNRLVVARVPRTAQGVTVTPRPETPFSPEIPHAIVRFEGVRVRAEDVLPGDGYERWLKPFRTIEDVHVLAATIGYLVSTARAHRWDDLALELLTLAPVVVDVAARDASAPVTHLELAGAFAAARRAAAEIPWDRAEPAERTRWERDAPLLWVAESARAKRTEAARRALGLSPSP